jgi:hypothetical protein
MPALRQSSCPRCGSALPLTKLFWHSYWSRSISTITGEVGLLCPTCQLALVVGRRRVAAISIVGGLVALGTYALLVQHFAADPKKSTPLQEVAFELTIVVVVVFSFLCAPQFARVRPRTAEDQVVFPLAGENRP